MVDTRFHAFSGKISIKDLLKKVGFEELAPSGREDEQIISGANELQNAKPNEISLAANRKYLELLSKTNAGCVIVHKSIIEAVPNGTLAILAKDPHLVFTKILEGLYPRGAKNRILRSQIEPKQNLEKDVFLSKGVVLGDNVEIGAETFLGANVTIGDGVTIGRNCVIEANSSIICSHIGDEVIIHSGVRVGTEGFGWLDIAKSNIKIPQLGRVIIQDKVEIGANSTIDRGALGDTTIGEGTKIDNLVQIGHNCNIGRYCLIAATTGLAGSTNIGDNCLLGGGVGSAGHLSVGANSIIHGRAAVTKDWPQGSRIIGAPAQDTKSFWKELAALKGLVKNKDEKI
ncbi:MAG: UDP-3-O-(3-hydroxymyristoyl)glucosamine N-acyltransferase [Devosiaceae bacterium]|nr:UDP-3-O-(3-hydroxymyristoyl)glucosamine N-acyltransferase [Devosiaceae bacterium]